MGEGVGGEGSSGRAYTRPRRGGDARQTLTLSLALSRWEMGLGAGRLILSGPCASRRRPKRGSGWKRAGGGARRRARIGRSSGRPRQALQHREKGEGRSGGDERIRRFLVALVVGMAF